MQNNTSDNSFVKKIVGFSFPSYFGAIITFIATMFNSRIYPKEVLGKINVFITVQSFIIYLSYLGVDQAYCRFYSECHNSDEQDNLFNVSFSLSFFACCILSVFCLLIWEPVSVYICGEEKLAVIICLILSSLAHIVCRFISLLQRLENRIVAYAILLSGMSVANKLSFSISGLFARTTSAAIIAISLCYVLLASTVWIVERKKKTVCIGKDLDKSLITKKILIYGLPLMPVSLLSWINSSIPTILMKRFLSYEAIGVYTCAVTLVSVINIIQSGFNAFIAPYYYENYKERQDLLFKVHDLISFLMISAGVLLMLFKNGLFMILGDSYRDGVVLFSLLMISPICYTVGETTGIGINISGKTYLHIFPFTLSSIINVFLGMILIPNYGITGAGIAVACSSIAGFAAKTIIGEKLYRSIGSYKRCFVGLVLLVLACICDQVFVKGFGWVIGLLTIFSLLLCNYKDTFISLLLYTKGFIKRDSAK